MRNAKCLTKLFVLLLCAVGFAPAPAAIGGEDCAGATPISNGEFDLAGNLTTMSDDYVYDMFGSGAGDAVYAFTLGASDEVAIFLAPENDLVMYLITDCNDPAGSLIAFSDDDPEYIFYSNVTGGPLNLYLVIDGYDAMHGGGAYSLTGTNEGTVAVEGDTWDQIKVMYR